MSAMVQVSRMTDTLTPLGVGREYRCSRLGCCAGHLRVTEKTQRWQLDYF